MFGVNEVRNRMAQILKMAQQDLGSNSCNSLMISAAEAELSNWLERHSSVLPMSRRWQPYSFFNTTGKDSDKASRLTSIRVNKVWSAKFFDINTEWVTWKCTKEKEVRNWFTIQKLLFLRLKHRANQVEKKYAQSQDDRVAKNWLRFQLLNCCWNLEITFNLDEISSTSCFNFRCACRLRSIGIQRKGSWCITNSVLYAAIAWKTKIILFDFVMLAFLEDNRPNSWRMHTA